MALNPNIILSAAPFDPTGAMDRGATAANRQNAFAREAAYNRTLDQSGAAAMRGDVDAQNALARFDPAAVQGLQSNALGMEAQQLGMQATRQNMDIQREELAMRREQARQEAAAALAAQQSTLDAAKMAEEAARARDLLVRAGRFEVQGDEVGYNLFLQQNGLDPAEYPMSDYRYIAATIEGVLDAVDAAAGPANTGPEWRAATPEEAAAFGAAAGQINTQTGKFDAAPMPRTQTTTIDPATGQVVISEGTGPSRPFTEAQSKDVVFATRALGALDVLDPIASSLVQRADIAAGYVPFGFGRELQNPDYQVARQAADEFLQAILRKDTGAAITEQEQALYGVTYLPQPGDGPEVLQAKAAARRRAVAAIEAGMSASQIIAQERALSAGGQAPNAQPAAPTPQAPQPGQVPDGIEPEVWQAMTPEERALFQ